ncbi:MAG: YifB family Mg chelatase-like AAA ATPase [Eubacterium sp.]|nr:YifB family Mg chelatase-like AAA ATPase [Eubacterium sp.]
MFCRIRSSAIFGVEALPVAVEADASTGLPVFSVIGYVSSQVREAQDRVRAAIRACGINLPPQRLTVNLAPGDLRKDGTRFDLPIAAAVLGAVGAIDPVILSDAMVLGELRLDGSVGRVSGVLPGVMCAKETGCSICIVPAENRQEAEIVSGIRIIGVRDLADLICYARGDWDGNKPVSPDGESCAAGGGACGNPDAGTEPHQPDFADIQGQAALKRCAVIAAAGFHNLLISGPPGAGKSMAAQRIPTILPELTREEQLEITKLYSIAGLLPADRPLIRARPFRSPHHSLTPAALCGGGKIPQPGEVTLAHRGVLFLDELPEMKRDTIELLRQPLEDHHITISRVGGTFDYPAGFLLVAAMNPCPCGYFPDRSKCQCSLAEIGQYRRKISHAMMDRIDLHCEVQAVTYQELTRESALSVKKEPCINSAMMQKQVNAAVKIQTERYRGAGIHFNSELQASQISQYCPVTDAGNKVLREAFETLGLSARGYHHILRVARTIADLEGSEMIGEAHVNEAIIFRNGD